MSSLELYILSSFYIVYQQNKNYRSINLSSISMEF